MIHKNSLLIALVGCLSLAPLAAEPAQPTNGQRKNEIAHIQAPIQIKHAAFEYTQYPVAPGLESNTGSSSGYHSLKNGALSLRLLSKKADAQPEIEAQLKNTSLDGELFGSEGAWRSYVLKHRRNSLATDFTKDSLHSLIKHGQKVALDDLETFLETFKFDQKNHEATQLRCESSVMIFDRTKFDTPEARATLKPLVKTLIPTSTAVVVAQAASLRGNATNYSVKRAELFTEFETAAQKKKTPVALSEVFMPFEQIEFAVESVDNNLTLKQGESIVKERSFNPSDKKGSAGDWLTIPELKALLNHEKENTASPLHADLQIAQRVFYLESAEDSSADDLLETYSQYIALLSELEKTPSPRAALVLIRCGNDWISCVASKINDKIYLVVTDPANKDRSQEPAILRLIEVLKDGFDTEKKNPGSELLFEKDGNSPKSTKEEDLANYDAPLANVPLDQLPSMEALFGGKIPNAVRLRLQQLERPAPTKQTVGDKIKNCLILYGPPGTGKSTIAQVIARKAGRDIIYAGGGDFRTSFQGSATKLLNALVAEAKKRVAAGKRVVILIDEIDGTSAKTEPRSSTEEDNRAIKSLIKILDQHQSDPNIYFMCTSNYPDKIDPAIFRRFNALEIPLPHYNLRKQIFLYYFDKNGIEVKDGAENAVTPAFFTDLITATEGLSGDAIGDLVINAVQEAEAGFEPETEIGLRFRYNNIDLSNRSIASNILPVAGFFLKPVAHFAGTYTNSLMDKHLYTQYMKQRKTKADVEAFEKVNDPERAARRDSFLKRHGKQTLSMIHQGVITKLTGLALLFGAYLISEDIGRAFGPNPYPKKGRANLVTPADGPVNAAIVNPPVGLAEE